MAEEVEMHTDLPYSEFLDPNALTGVVDSRSFLDGAWREKVTLKDFKNGINKVVLPINVSSYKIIVMTEVEPGRLIKRHKHDDEPQFRYVLAGSMILNGEKYGPGEWVVVPQGVEYEIYTHEGYRTLAGYGMSCQCSAVGGH